MAFSFAGSVCCGLGEGSRYTERYSKEFKRSLGTDFFPGTLNVAVRQKPDFSAFDLNSIRIGGFTENGETFHAVLLIPATVAFAEKRARCYITIPEKTRHKNQVEIVAGVNLREKLRVSDGDVVEIIID